MYPVNVPAKFEVRSWDNSGYFKTLGSPWIRRSRSSKVVDFGTNRKCVCDFLLVRHSNLDRILHRFGDIAGFCPDWVTPPLLYPNFRGVSVASDHPCWGEPEQKPYVIGPWNYFRSIPTYVITVRKRRGRTDGRTDGRHSLLWQYRALRIASRGNYCHVHCRRLTNVQQDQLKIQDITNGACALSCSLSSL